MTLALVSLGGCIDRNASTDGASETSTRENATSSAQVDSAAIVWDTSDSILKFNTKQRGVLDTTLTYPINKGILAEEYTENDILFQKEFGVESDTLGVVIVSGEATSGEEVFTPIKSILYKRRGADLCYIVIPSSNEDDFKHYFTKEDLIVFGYSSVVGYTELYLYDRQESELMKSEKLDEADRLDKSSFKAGTMSFEASNYADSVMTKNLQKIDWDRCQP